MARAALSFLFLLQQVIARQPLSIRIGGIFDPSDSIRPASLASSTAILNNSSSILPDTRVDLHSLYSEEDFLSTYQAICDQLQYSAFTIFSGVKQDAVVSDVLNKFHVPHLSTDMVSETERKERPFSLFLGPSKEDMTKIVEETVKALTQPGGMVGLISHQSSILLSNTLLTNLQHYKLGVMVEDLTEKDIRPNLVRIRKKEVKTIIVDVAADLVKPFIFQALQAGLLQPGVCLLFTALDFSHLPSIEHAQLTGAMLLGYSLLAGHTGQDWPGQSDYRSVLLHDSLLLFGSSLSSLSTSSDPVTERLNCSEPDKVSSQGDKMLKHLHRARLEGLTGKISFTDGRRDSMLMNLVIRGEEGRKTVGVFDTGSNDLILDRNILDELEIGNSEERVKVYVTVNLTNAHRFLSEVLDNVSGYFQVDIEWKQQFGNTSLSESRQQKHLQAGHLLLLDAPTLLTLGKAVAVTVPLLSSYHQQPPHLPPLPMFAWLGLLISLLLTSLTLSLLSWLSPYQRSHAHLSLLDSLWCSASTMFLSLPHARLKSVSTRLLMLGWSLFCVSFCLLLSQHLHLHTAPGHISPQPQLYLAGSRQAEDLLHRLNTGMLLRHAKVANTTISPENTDKEDKLLATLWTSFLLLLLLLLSSLVVSVCELLMFCWHNKDRQKVWSALRGEIVKIVSRTRTGEDQVRQDSKQSLVREEDRQHKKLLGQEHEEEEVQGSRR